MTETTLEFRRHVSLRLASPSLPPSAPRPVPHQSSSSFFTQLTSRLDYEISLVEREVKSDQLTQNLSPRFMELEQTLGRIQLPAHCSSQVDQHAERVKASLERRLKDAAKVFKQSLEARAQTLSVKQERRENLFGHHAKLYSYKTLPPTSSPQLPVLPPPPSSLPSSQPQANNFRRRAQPLIRESYQNPPFVLNQQLQQSQLQQEYTAKSSAEMRSADAHRLEKTINDIGQLFYRVAGLVQEQGDLLVDLEANLDDTVQETNEAQSQLLKLFRFVSGDRQLILGLFLAVTVVGCIIIYFLV